MPFCYILFFVPPFLISKSLYTCGSKFIDANLWVINFFILLAHGSEFAKTEKRNRIKFQRQLISATNIAARSINDYRHWNYSCERQRRNPTRKRRCSIDSKAGYISSRKETRLVLWIWESPDIFIVHFERSEIL